MSVKAQSEGLGGSCGGGDSSLLKGALFWFEIAYCPDTDSSIEGTESNWATSVSPPRLSARHLLVVDDSAAVRDSVASFLDAEGHVVDTAQNGKQALLKMKSRLYDLVLSDVQMPRLNGFGLTNKFRSWERKADRPRQQLILMSGNWTEAEIAEGRAAGADGHLRKPIQPIELLAILAEALPRTSPQEQAISPTVPLKHNNGKRYMSLLRDGLQEAAQDLQKLEEGPSEDLLHKMQGTLAQLVHFSERFTSIQ